MTLMFKIRARASRKAWMLRNKAFGVMRYNRIVAYELRRNRTEAYTPIWAVS